MVRLVFAPDSKRHGAVVHARNLATVLDAVKCSVCIRIEPQKLHGYPRAWEVTCGDTVVADAMELPRGAGEDYFPRYKLGGE